MGWPGTPLDPFPSRRCCGHGERLLAGKTARRRLARLRALGPKRPLCGQGRRLGGRERPVKEGLRSSWG